MTAEQTLTPSKDSLAAYPVLVRRVRQAIARGKERALDAAELELTRTKWEVGKLILEHILLNRLRGKYGEDVLKRLSKDLGTSVTELKYMVEYARSTPNRPHAGDLNWGKLRELLAINDEEKRAVLVRQAIQKKWSRQTLRREIAKLRAAKQITVSTDPDSGHLEVKRGKLGVYRVIEVKSKKAYDLGFSTYLEIKGRVPKQPDPPAEELYTYEAEVEEVIDGDTLWAKVHLGFGVWTHQKLRFRGLDAPEIMTRDGQAAKKFLERQFKLFPNVVMTSTKSDKYDRYLADIWAGETFINQKLIDKGLAVRVSE